MAHREKFFNKHKRHLPTCPLHTTKSNGYSITEPKHRKVILKKEIHTQKRKLGDINPDLNVPIKKDWKSIRDNESRPKVAASNNDDNWLIQWASKCYDEGLLTHLRHLEAVGKESAIAEKRRGTKKFTCSPSSNHSHSILSGSDTSNNSSAKKFFSAIKRIAHIKRPTLKHRQIHIHNTYDDESYLPSSDCNIRVEITSSAEKRDNRVKFHKSSSDSGEEGFGANLKNSKPESGDSMNHMLSTVNGNYCITNRSGTVDGIQINGHSIRNDQVNELIESLYHLDITGIGTLPKIILTDFSTSPDTTTTNSTPHISALTPSSEIIGTKPVNFDLNDFDGCLIIPNEKNYRSEARPP